jgi:penicillin-binding protein 1A
MAARSYFGKPANALTLAEGALLAAMTKGPTYFSADRHPERARERLSYVLDRMQEDGAITADQTKQALAQTIALTDHNRAQRDTGFYFVDQVTREAKALAGIDTLAGSAYTVHSTIRPDLQRATEVALQEGLVRYERDAGRVQFKGRKRTCPTPFYILRRRDWRVPLPGPPWLPARRRSRPGSKRF